MAEANDTIMSTSDNNQIADSGQPAPPYTHPNDHFAKANLERFLRQWSHRLRCVDLATYLSQVWQRAARDQLPPSVPTRPTLCTMVRSITSLYAEVTAPLAPTFLVASPHDKQHFSRIGTLSLQAWGNAPLFERYASRWCDSSTDRTEMHVSTHALKPAIEILQAAATKIEDRDHFPIPLYTSPLANILRRSCIRGLQSSTAKELCS